MSAGDTSPAALLPHRYPFLLIDRVREVEPGQRLVAVKNITRNEPQFTGHFPDRPIMPGVLIVEALAQAAGILGFVTANKRPSDGFIYLLVGTDKARFKRQVVPGDRLTLHAEWLTLRRNIAKFSCRAEVDGKVVAVSDLLVAEQRS